MKIQGAFPVRWAAQNGADGRSYERIYKSLSSYISDLAAPTSTDSDGAVPSGWSASPTGVTQNLPYEYRCERSKNNGVWGQWSTPKVSARWSQDGTSVAIKYNEKVFKHYRTYSDFYNEYPNPYTSGMDYNDVVLIDDCTGYSETTDGGQTIVGIAKPTILQFIASPDLNFYMIVPNEGDGCLDTETQTLWMPNADKWVDLGNIKGPKGDDGDDAVVYELVPEVNVINANADGTITTGDIVLHAYKVVGSERSSDVLYYFLTENQGEHAQFAIDNGSWTDCSSRGIPRRQAAETYIPAASVQSATTRIRLRLLDGNNAVCGVCPDITIVRNGAKGDKGRMFYLAGTYDSTKLYQRTDDVCPIVYYENGSTKEYWYLDAASAQGVAPSDVAGNPWKKAENFGITITEALFANFGKLGAWVFHNQYQISQYGVDGTNNYTNFTDENGNWKPVTLLNALSGLAWFGGGKIRFNADGSGHLAGGNISWTPAGVATFNGVVNASGGTFNGTVTSENTALMNKILMDGQNGKFALYGPNGVSDDDHSSPAEGAYPIELFSISFETDADTLHRYAMIEMKEGEAPFLQSLLTIEPQRLDIRNNYGGNSYLNYDRLGFSNGDDSRIVEISNDGVSLWTNGGFAYKSWEQIFNNQ